MLKTHIYINRLCNVLCLLTCPRNERVKLWDIIGFGKLLIVQIPFFRSSLFRDKVASLCFEHFLLFPLYLFFSDSLPVMMFHLSFGTKDTVPAASSCLSPSLSYCRPLCQEASDRMTHSVCDN